MAATRRVLLVSACLLALVARSAEAQTEERIPWLQWDYATGDWDGNRKVWSGHGVDFLATYTAQVWGTTVGGLQPGASYTGLLQFGMNADFEKALGWKGGSFRTTWLWISGGQPSVSEVGSLLAVSPIEGPPSFRVLDLWLQQRLFDDVLNLRAGVFNADAEFTVSDNAALFQNAGFGWPTFYAGTRGGAPVYPFAAPGIHAAAEPGGGWKIHAAAMQSEVPAPEDNPSNFAWRLDRSDGFLLLGEIQRGDPAARMPGQAKAGVIFNTGSDDSGAWGSGFVYGIIDRMFWRESAAGDPQGAAWFARGGFAVSPNTDLLSLVNTGFTYTGLFPGRDADTAGCAFCWAQLSPGASEELEGGNRGLEMVVEWTYQAQITPWFTLQPDVQFILQPGGSTALGNALVVGLSAALAF